MLDQIQPQLNFPANLLPPNTEGFYNSKGFMQNEMMIFGTQLSMMNRAVSEGLKQMKEALEQ